MCKILQLKFIFSTHCSYYLCWGLNLIPVFVIIELYLQSFMLLIHVFEIFTSKCHIQCNVQLMCCCILIFKLSNEYSNYFNNANVLLLFAFAYGNMDTLYVDIKLAPSTVN